MNIQTFFRSFTLSVTVTLLATQASLGQQWTGSENLTGLLQRDGNMQANLLSVGKLGSPLLDNTDPYAIYSNKSYSNTLDRQDLVLFGNGQSAILDLRIYDGSFKVGPFAIPNAVIHNDGSAIFRSKLEVQQSSNTEWALFVTNSGGFGKGIRIQAAAPDNGTPLLQIEDNLQNTRFVVNTSGGVGINTPNATLHPDFKLSVNGKIRAKEIKVESNWPDFVFGPGYRLRPLAEVEAHIKAHGHLPGVPSAKVVQAEGIGLGEANTLLLQKVEELTLYLIEQKKEIDKLNKEMEGLKRKRKN